MIFIPQLTVLAAVFLHEVARAIFFLVFIIPAFGLKINHPHAIIKPYRVSYEWTRNESENIQTKIDN